ncbi:MAG TPA: bifunctional diaminohydroxyphosphoribosylaminopyrimidine deaminase/5-amino-6-(5-phosphoribosylamino)uracil reductase RibD, partial [Coriobacteriia bacterium]|nr:bifunctional diaminohydroxyphosphoribosylaminopyrimidine deaminase/5-amino-6-(5-phosphoribosylamino)uracil reductase RibD [Coriobacteriia bacterium]
MRLFADDSALIEEPHLRRAYTLALNGLGTTSPNPMVGCVIVNGGHVVGEGWHERAGGPHAEVVALARAADFARGATAYVTLEPCSHRGRTPPCVDALVRAGISELVLGMADPTPLASGGAERLRHSGMRVTFAADPAPFEELNEGWLSLVRRDRPWVSVKVAATLDGKVAEAPGTRSAISCDDSRAVTMTLRARSDAVMVGASTALTDGCVLTVRGPAGADEPRQPVRVVLSRTTDPTRAPVLSDGRAPAAVLLPADVSFALPAGVEVLTYDPD